MKHVKQYSFVVDARQIKELVVGLAENEYPIYLYAAAAFDSRLDVPKVPGQPGATGHFTCTISSLWQGNKQLGRSTGTTSQVSLCGWRPLGSHNLAAAIETGDQPPPQSQLGVQKNSSMSSACVPLLISALCSLNMECLWLERLT